ncbi:MAG: HlyD family efflux transporter periplasmic adaptor subunit [Muribaculaceae bacterium]|nr:HlyD family efflux transporter periplasmic adaptor subunit [Muribaculaceae bacterium]
MDREIPTKDRRKILMKKMLPVAIVIVALATCAIWLAVWLSAGIKETELNLVSADTGEIESAVVTNGRIIPAFEEIIVSPVNTRILEVFVQEGDSVASGTPLLRLDTENARNDYQRMADELSIKQSEIKSQELTDETQLTDLEMRIRTKELSENQLKAEYESERRLDSIGSGTGERVRHARLAWQTADLELQQMRRQLENERRIRRSMADSKRLEGNISARNLAEVSRTLDDARVLAPRSGNVTFLSSNIGATVAAGEKIAIISDLSNFKVTGDLPEGYGDKLSVGVPVEIRSGKLIYRGKVSNMAAQSKAGVIPFVVSLDQSDAPGLRAGMTARISIIYDIRPNVVRIPYGNFFNGPGEYDLYVRTSPISLERRKVKLGDSNLDYIEVISGLKVGETVNINKLESNSKKLRIWQ